MWLCLMDVFLCDRMIPVLIL
uniref:Uncharacterized protein n=1 Tax=Arundo donax TaxID=35708 RepID=A0A0A9BYW4_ARUDO